MAPSDNLFLCFYYITNQMQILKFLYGILHKIKCRIAERYLLKSKWCTFRLFEGELSRLRHLCTEYSIPINYLWLKIYFFRCFLILLYSNEWNSESCRMQRSRKYISFIQKRTILQYFAPLTILHRPLPIWKRPRKNKSDWQSLLGQNMRYQTCYVCTWKYSF